MLNNLWNSSNKKEISSINMGSLPQHIAIIMDGNGRWGTERMLPRNLGHKAGVEALRDVIKTASNIGVQYLTLYAFSTENWKRPVSEVSFLMKLLIEYLRKEIAELHENNVKIQIIGDVAGLPKEVIKEIEKATIKTMNNQGLCVNIALNYGSRAEITDAIKKIAKMVENQEIQSDDIDESLVHSFLYTAATPDPDLLIRTSGELRLSNFLLWQCAYSELWFTDVYWPDFTGEHLIMAITDYQNRKRRFGGI
ncbi:isoprenyl transferase [Alkaliphilus oremlandii]|uniref:Isoprenyl transferase n=1 Tax=Alkaliphilus oremlandii (strain OhILAs) TaxID=350688 RepID=A8MHH3_ALKOO|nr:isoprenyl transferase [Alkaliphilus oremlandii]ABW19060.1 undecaprenyl diphosphate synthase [Alkaliphilus oremlandii OhILAs]